jgi:hypothetical protein
MKKTLLQSNGWLKDEVKREAALHRTAATSSAIEGIFKPFADALKVNALRKPANSTRLR